MGDNSFVVLLVTAEKRHKGTQTLMEYSGIFAVNRDGLDEVQNLPEPEDGIVYIVSALVAAACHARKDVVSPATGHPNAVRKDGQVYSVPGFVRG